MHATWNAQVGFPLATESRGGHPSRAPALRALAPATMMWYSGGQVPQLCHPSPDSVIALHGPWGLHSTCVDSNTASWNTSAISTAGQASGFIADEWHSRGTSHRAFFGLCTRKLSFTAADKHIILCLQTGAFLLRLHFSTAVMTDALPSHEE